MTQDNRENQDRVESELLNCCPLCGNDDLISVFVNNRESPLEGLLEQDIYNLNMSPDWECRICEECGISWGVCTWVVTEFDDIGEF